MKTGLSDTPETARLKRLIRTLRARKLRLETKRGSAGATAKPQGHHTSKGHMMTGYQITRSQALATVRYFTVEWHEQFVPLTVENYLPTLVDFTSDLGSKVGLKLKWAAVGAAVDTMDDLAAVDDGTSPYLQANKARTVWNAPELTEHLESILDDAIAWVIDSATSIQAAA